MECMPISHPTPFLPETSSPHTSCPISREKQIVRSLWIRQVVLYKKNDEGMIPKTCKPENMKDQACIAYL